MLTTTEVIIVLSGVPVGMILTTIVACLMEGRQTQNTAKENIVVIELPVERSFPVFAKHVDHVSDAPMRRPALAEAQLQ